MATDEQWAYLLAAEKEHAEACRKADESAEKYRRINADIQQRIDEAVNTYRVNTMRLFTELTE